MSQDIQPIYFLAAITSLVIVAHACGFIFVKFAMPKVVGEIFGGILLGPSAMGALFPETQAAFFRDNGTLNQSLEGFYWLGLICLMFSAGFHMQKIFSRHHATHIVALLLGSTLIPLMGAWGLLQLVDVSPYAGTLGDRATLNLILAIAAAVSSIPVISRIFMDLGIIESDFAKRVLAAATVHDLLLWIILSLVLGTVTGIFQGPGDLFAAFVVTIVFALAIITAGPRVIDIVPWLRLKSFVQNAPLGCTLIWLLSVTLLGAALHIHSVFCAFVAGASIGSSTHPRIVEAKRQINDFGAGFFVPLYFSMVGLKINLLLHWDLLLFLTIFVFSSLLMIASVLGTMRLSGATTMESWNYAFAMNTRGGPGIVLASLVFDAGIVDYSLYIALTLNAIVTSMIGGVWFRHVTRNGLL